MTLTVTDLLEKNCLIYLNDKIVKAPIIEVNEEEGWVKVIDINKISPIIETNDIDFSPISSDEEWEVIPSKVLTGKVRVIEIANKTTQEVK